MPRFQPEELIRHAAEIIALAGSTETEARQVAENLVEANLRGHDSHGVGMIPQYVQALREGGLKANTAAVLREDRGPILVFDGQRGYGQVLGKQVIEAGIERARAYGVSIVGLADSHHLGRIGAWAEQATAAGLISIHFANVFSKARVVPWNGILPRLGTNPFCVGIPRKDLPPLILDFATSIIASGKARVAYQQGKQLEPGQALDHLGHPTTDPRDIVEPPFGSLLPFGQHKGGGLALVCSLLGAALTGSPTERKVKSGSKAIVNGMLSILIDPQAFGGLDTFQEETEAFLDWVRLSRPDNGLLLPGEPELHARTSRASEGIEIEEGTWRALQETRQALLSRSEHVLS